MRPKPRHLGLISNGHRQTQREVDPKNLIFSKDGSPRNFALALLADTCPKNFSQKISQFLGPTFSLQLMASTLPARPGRRKLLAIFNFPVSEELFSTL